MSGFFITGTDTGVGKTYVTLLLTRQLIAEGNHVAALKPVASGATRVEGNLCNADALQLQAANNVALSYAEINPYCFADPIPPHLAASLQHTEIDFTLIAQQLQHAQTRADVVLVEGVGGWLAPLRTDATVADLAATLRLPVLLVVGLRLGCLNHALLSVQAIQHSGCVLAGWIANTIDPTYTVTSESINYLRAHISAPCVAMLGYQSAKFTQLSEVSLLEIFQSQ